MKIYSWNVNGIRSVERKGSLAEFITNHQPDIICFQETKANPSQLELDYPDYQKYWSSAQKAGYSGTAIWTKQPPLSASYNLPDEIITRYSLTQDPYGDPTNEGRITTLEFEDFYLVTVYTPNSKGDLSRLPLRRDKWDPAFTDYVTQLQVTKPVVFCGDLNVAHTEIDLANVKPNIGKHGFTDEERSGFDNFIEAGFIDTFRAAHPDKVGAYTWWTHWANSRARNVGWRIDYLLVSQSLASRVADPQIHPDVMGSDHCPVSLYLTN